LARCGVLSKIKALHAFLPETVMSNFDLKALEKHNGREGKPSHVAVNGEVYDVSASPMWEDGDHMGQHRAGCDLTEALFSAPHGKEVFEHFQKVGVLAPAEAVADGAPRRIPPPWASMLLSIHSHPIASHFPQAFFVFAPLFLVLFYATGARSFERTAYHLLYSSFLMAFPATATGFIHWWYKYGGRSRPVFKLKIVLSALLLPASGFVLAFHTARGALAPDSIQWALLFLYLLMIPLVVWLGRAGGLIVFNAKGR
jgi:predicted heme/steroid binding protein/uncharacterized membrane protein